MKILKGFVNIQAMLSNTPDVVSPVGELSVWGYTYSREMGEYTHASSEGYRLLATHSVDTETGPVPVGSTMVAAVLDFAKAAVIFGNAKIQPYDRVEFMAHIQATPGLYSALKNIEFGDFKYGNNLGLPEWFSFNLASGGDYAKIWLSNEAFVNQYDEYHITVVPPIDDLSKFFLPFGTVSSLMSAVSMTEIVERIQNAKGDDPETFVRSFNFDYSLPSDRSNVVKTTWSVLINGIAGDNIDSIKDAIAAYILSNSTRPKADWEAIFPEIFKRTEFIILPRWDKMSVPNLTVKSGLYGSMIDPNEAVSFCKKFFTFYTQDHISKNITVFPYDYKAVMLHAVNGPDNRPSAKTLVQVFPDYIPVPTTSMDFSRMQYKTQQWAYLLGEMLLAAENANKYNTINAKLRKVYRENKLYISASHENISYLVAARSNYGLSA